MLDPRLSQVLHQVVGADEVGLRAILDGPEGQSHGQMGLAHAGRTQEQDVASLGDEGQVGQFLDQALVDGGLEGKVELVQSALEGQVGQLGPGGEVAFPPSSHLHPQQVGQHLRVGQLLAGGGVQGVVQGLDGLFQSQGLQVFASLFQRDHRVPPRAASS